MSYTWRQTASLPLKYNMFRLGFTSSSVPFTYFILCCIRVSFNLSAGTRRDKLLHCHQTVCECLVTGGQAVRALLLVSQRRCWGCDPPLRPRVPSICFLMTQTPLCFKCVSHCSLTACTMVFKCINVFCVHVYEWSCRSLIRFILTHGLVCFTCGV